jgi:hypothetical protein
MGEGAERLHELCRSRLGLRRLTVMREWCGALTEGGGSERHTVLHGEPTLGLVVPASDGSKSVLLTGETLSHGPPEFDVGWLLGELAEMADIARRHLPADARVPPFPSMAAALLEERADQDAVLGRALLGRVATLRRLAHAVDFAAYVGWNAGVEAYVETLTDLVDSDGQQTLTQILDAAGGVIDATREPRGVGACRDPVWGGPDRSQLRPRL